MVWAAEDDNVIGIEGDARGRVSCGQPVDETKLHGTDEHRVQDVDDDGE